MATKTKKATENKIDMLVNREAITDFVKDMNATAYEIASDVVDEVLVTSGRWTDLVDRSLTKTTKLIDNQQDKTWEVIELAKKNLVGKWDRVSKMFSETVDLPELREEMTKTVNKVTKQVNEALNIDQADIKKVTNKVKTTAKKAETTAKKVTKKAEATAKQVTKKAETTAKKVTKKAETTAKQVTKKAETTAKQATKKVAATLDDLQTISGIGPKMNENLKKLGINSYTQLAKMTPAELTKLLEDNNINTRLVNPEGWIMQAKQLVK